MRLGLPPTIADHSRVPSRGPAPSSIQRRPDSRTPSIVRLPSAQKPGSASVTLKGVSFYWRPNASLSAE